MFGKKTEEFKSIRVKRGVWEIKSRLTNAGEVFDVYFSKNQVASCQDQGIKELMVVLADLQHEHNQRG